MVAPAPPVVIGPIIETCTGVRVDGVIANAAVVVTADDGTKHAEGSASVNGTAWLVVSVPFRAGTTLTAQQTIGADVSGPSATKVPVEAPPHDLPRPVFRTVLNECSDAALLSGLVPGAEITVRRGAAVVGQEQIDRTRQWIRFNVVLAAGQALSASQTLPGSNPSEISWSDPVSQVSRETGISTPIIGAISECQASVDISNVIPTALVTLATDDGRRMAWNASDIAFRANLSQRLPSGRASIRQVLPACDIRSQTSTVDISPEQKPPKPQPWSFCPEGRKIRVDGLVAQATVTFGTTSWDNNGGGWGPEAPLMVAGAVGGTQEFDLPHIVGGGVGPIVNIVVRQTTCTRTSDPGYAPEYVRPNEAGIERPSAEPQIVEPVYACVDTVRLDPSGWGTGVLRSRHTGLQLADAFAAHGQPAVIHTWFPLTAGDRITVEYTGCDAPDPIEPPILVQDVPSPLPDVKIIPPVPGDTELVVTEAMPGARVIALVDNKVRASRPTIDGNATLAMAPPLTDDQTVWAYQRLCGAVGNNEGSIPVEKATITAVATPADGVLGTPKSFVITATRDGTGITVSGLPVELEGSIVGVTGSNFVWTPAGQGTLSGKVKGGKSYSDATFTIRVPAPPPPPPPPPVLSLRIELGGYTPGYYPLLKVSMLQWTVEPLWGGVPATVVGTPATVAFPAPGGPKKPQVRIIPEFVGTLTEDGIPYQLYVELRPAAVVVDFDQTSMLASFWLALDRHAIYNEEGYYVGTRPKAVLTYWGKYPI